MISCLNAVTIGGAPPLREYIALAKKHGFGGVEFSIGEASSLSKEITQPAMIDLFKSSGVAPAAFGLPVEWRKDAPKFQEDLKNLPVLARLAQEMGCTAAGAWIPPTVAQDALYFRNQALRRLHDIASILGDFGIRVALEWVGPYTSRKAGLDRGEQEFIWNIPATLELIEDIDAPADNVGLLVDSFHWFTTGATENDIVKLGNKIVHVHINDAPDKPRDEQMDLERLLPGDGVIDLQAFIRGLKVAGYNGFVAIETFSKELSALGHDEAARRAAASIKGLL
jgi:sugar phosphate isomerase/epimerase